MLSKKVKSTLEKLNSHQLLAVKAAHDGNYTLILQCILDCESAILKAERVKSKAAMKWALGTISHYNEIQTFLISQIASEEVRNTIWNDLLNTRD